jgi:Antitoxin VbhA
MVDFTETEEDRRRSMAQGLANTRIEGHVPSGAFLADCERFVRGEMTSDELGAASLARALEADRIAAQAGRLRDAAQVR